MVFVGPRRNLRKISETFKAAWISFIRAYNRFPKVEKSNLTTPLRVMESELVSIAQKGNTTPSFRENILGLLVQIRALIKEISLNDEFKSKLKKGIKEAKSLIKITADSNVNMARRNFMSSVIAAGGLALAGCSPTRFLTEPPEIAEKVIRQDVPFKLISSEGVVAKGSEIYLPLQQIIPNFKFLLVYIIHNGEAKKTLIKKEDLKQGINPTLICNGFIVSIFVVTSSHVKTVHLNNTPLKEAKVVQEKHFSRVDQQKITQEVLHWGKSKFHFDYMENIGLHYSEINELRKPNRKNLRFFFVGEPFAKFLFNEINETGVRNVNNQKENVLVFTTDSGSHGLYLKQEVPRIVEKQDPNQKESYDDLVFIYVGNNPQRIYRINEIRSKLNAIVQGIYNVEKIFGDFVGEVKIVDYNIYLAEAYLEENRRSIHFYTLALKDYSSYWALLAAEHEVLHILDDNFGYHKNSNIRDLFADLHGLADSTRKEVIDNGSVKGLRSQKPIFRFINESNYFNQKMGGHSEDNTNEFVTTFLHALMYIEVFQENIMKLEESQRALVIADFKKIAETLKKIAPRRHRSFFTERSAVVDAIERKINKKA